MKRTVIVGVGLLTSLLWMEQGAQSVPTTRDTRDQHSAIQITPLTDSESHQAKRWLLSDQDWLKYKAIMQGPRGRWSPQIDPITALGVSETDLSERQRYAELWIRLEAQRVERELAFEVARQQAAHRLLNGQVAIDNQRWIHAWMRPPTGVKKRVMLFVDSGCREPCRALFKQVYATLDVQAQLDIYFREPATADAIRQWATAMAIAPELVQQRRVTLNFDDGTFARMKVDSAQLPQIRVQATPATRRTQHARSP